MRHLVARGRVFAVAALTSVLLPTLVALPITSLPAPAVAPAKPELTEVPAGIDGTTSAGARVAAPLAPGSSSPQTVEGPVKDVGTFQTVGVSWAEGSLAPGSRVELRVRTRDGWSSWSNVPADDAAPDPGTADARAAERTRGRTASAPLWVGGDADAVQTRVVVPVGAQPPSEMSVLAVNAPSVPLPRSSEPLASADAAAAPRIMTRAQWGADERLRTSKAGCATPSYNKTIKVAVVHHTAGTNSYTQAQVPSVIQGIYAYHTGGQGWCDVGYNFLIDKFGTIWEGRYGGIDKAVIGAHAGGFNVDTFGLSFLGNYDVASATPAMLDSASKLIAWKLGMYNRNPLGSDTLTSAGGGTSKYAAGQRVTLRVVSGHRDVGNTTCPGQYVYSKLDTLRNAAAGLAPTAPSAAIVSPKVTTKPRTPVFNGSSDVTAGLAASGTWTLTASDRAGKAVRTYSGSGTKVAQTWDMRDSAAKPVPAGTYTVRLESVQGGTAAPSWQGTVNTGYWLGGVDSITGGSESVQVAGWAARSETAAPVKVRVDVDGAAAATAVADRARPDVAAVYPDWGAAHGYSIQAPAKAGVHKVCASGVDPADGTLTQLGCKDVVVTPSSDPFGSVDSVAAAPGPRSVRVRGWVIDPDTTAPAQVHVYVNGRIAHMGPAALTRSDVAAAYPYGSGHGYDVTIPVADPSVEVCAYGINVGAGSNQLLGCRKVSLPTGSPFGSVDSAAASGHGRIRVAGWTIDPDTSDAADVQVFVDGKVAWAGSASGLRRDVGAAYPGWGDKHGYDVTLPVFPGGTRTVCVNAVNAGPSAPNTQLACRSVTLPTGSPFGSVDSGVVTAPGQVRMQGWMVDPDSAASLAVHVYVDGRFTKTATADKHRGDIAAAFPAHGGAHGYDITLPVFPGGGHEVCVYGINAGPSAPNSLVGCRTLTLATGQPWGSVDSVASESKGTLRAQGWSLDPDSPGQVQVHGYLDGRIAFIKTAGTSRGDLAVAFPAHGAQHGYDVTVNASAGRHELCVYAINTGAAAANPLLGCRTVTVR